MKVIDVAADICGRMLIRYGMDSKVALVEVVGPLLGSPDVLRELARALALAAADIEGGWLDCTGLAAGEFIRVAEDRGGQESPCE